MQATVLPLSTDSAEAALNELWLMASRYRAVSPSRLLQLLPIAVEGPLDERSKLLIRDALDALRDRFGQPYITTAIQHYPGYANLVELWNGEFDKVGFRTLGARLMEPTTPAQVERFFRELGRSVRSPVTIHVAGSAVLIVNHLIVRSTRDIDVVDEIPASIRENHALLDELRRSTNLSLELTASRYYPTGWQQRSRSFGKFGELVVYMLDPYDQLVGKLFSRRIKDIDDLKDAWDALDHVAFRDRLQQSTRGLREVPHITEKVKENWYVLTGEEDLPPLLEST